jgi:hypothetical protein
MEVEAIGPYLDRLADDWTNGVDHGMAWPLKIVAPSTGPSRAPGRWRTRRSSWPAASASSPRRASSGFLRDARLGRIHPANPALAHELVGKLSLGINPDEQAALGLEQPTRPGKARTFPRPDARTTAT